MSKVYEPVEHVSVWVDGGIHIKTSEPHGDPVEMSEEDALVLAALLKRLAEEQQ